MPSIHSLLFALLIFSELSDRLVTEAMPANKIDDSAEDGRGSLLDEDQVDETFEGRRNLALGMDGEKRPRIIVISASDFGDMRLRGHSVPALTAEFSRGLPLMTERRFRSLPADNHIKIERRDTDLDVLRCMIGRVYRPCWEV